MAYKPKKDYLFVLIQVMLFIAFLLKPALPEAEPFLAVKILSALFVLDGIALLIWALWTVRESLSPFPSPTAHSKLICTGPYKYMRHPIYTAIMLIAFSMSLFLGSYFKLIISVLLLVLFWFKSQYEERLLMKHYPDYPSYAEKTGRFLPKL